jgi:hypothetical protein
MKKIIKGKVEFNDLFLPYKLEDPLKSIFSNSNYVIQFEVVSEALESTSDEIVMYEHEKLTMGVESKVRSLLISLDSLLNKGHYKCNIRPLPKTLKKPSSKTS